MNSFIFWVNWLLIFVAITYAGFWFSGTIHNACERIQSLIDYYFERRNKEIEKLIQQGLNANKFYS